MFQQDVQQVLTPPLLPPLLICPLPSSSLLLSSPFSPHPPLLSPRPNLPSPPLGVCVCVQVMDWVEHHGEVFLSKHTGVGKSLHRARALQKRHDDFEDVAQVSLSVCLSVCS